MSTTTCTVHATGETFTLDEFGVVRSPATGNLTLNVYECDDGRTVRVSRRGADLGRAEVWDDGRWHCGTGAELRPIGVADSLAGVVALFADFQVTTWTPARGYETR